MHPSEINKVMFYTVAIFSLNLLSFIYLCILVWSPQSHRTVGSLWRESGLNWTDFLPEGEDVQAFISQQVGAKCLLSNEKISLLRGNLVAFHQLCPNLSFVIFLDTNRNSSLFCRMTPALRQLSLKGCCLLKSWADSWRDSSWRTWPVTSRSSTG